MRRPATSGRRAAKSSKNRRTPVDSERGARAWPPWLDALLEALPDAAVLFDTAGKLIAANRLFLEIYGLSTANAKRLDLPAYRDLLVSAVARRYEAPTCRALGSGLGLPICYKITKEHGGRIDVRSELGRGTTFTVRLPLNAPARQRA